MKIGYFFLLFVSLLYLILFFFFPNKAYMAFIASLQTLKNIAPILFVVLFLMAFLSLFFDVKKISRYLGKESGVKGWIVAIFSGILSHGPTYLWYPLLQELREKGAKDGLIVAFMYARSIKLPWLPLMVSYFGTPFTVILTFSIIVGSLLQGLIVDKIELYLKQK